jgi:hypothetical protein
LVQNFTIPKENGTSSSQSWDQTVNIDLFRDIYWSQRENNSQKWTSPIKLTLFVLFCCTFWLVPKCCSLISSAFSSPVNHFFELSVWLVISFYLKIFVLINANWKFWLPLYQAFFAFVLLPDYHFLRSSLISRIAWGDFEVFTLNNLYLDITPLFNRRDHRIRQTFLVSPTSNIDFRY